MTISGAERLFNYPYRRLTRLLEGIPPGANPILTHVGEPQGAPPDFLSETVLANAHLWSKYPDPRGTADYLGAVADWLTRRYALSEGMIDPQSNLTTACGTREALFQAGLLAASLKRAELPDGTRPLLGLPNPAYHVYFGAALMGECDVLAAPAADADTDYLPDYTLLSGDELQRLAIAYLCSPSNPTGGVASAEWLKKHILLAREHNFILAVDECYSEIYNTDTPPAGAAEICHALGGDLSNVRIFNSLSKRSSAPGLRAGFVAGTRDIIDKLVMLRGYGGAQIPEPLMAAGAALWRDDAHVAGNRALYSRLFDKADHVLGDLPGYFRPQGGFFLWQKVSNGENVARALWQREGVKSLPGRFMSHPIGSGDETPGDSYVRIALVHAPDTVDDLLGRVHRVLVEDHDRAIMPE